MYRRNLAAFGRDRGGAVALEYVLLASGIGVALLISIFLLGDDLSAFWNALNNNLAT